MLPCDYHSAYDADKTYPLQVDASKLYAYHDPTQSPIAPPYAVAISMRRDNTLAREGVHDGDVLEA